jgi:hypothetical protein
MVARLGPAQQFNNAILLCCPEGVACSWDLTFRVLPPDAAVEFFFGCLGLVPGIEVTRLSFMYSG